MRGRYMATYIADRYRIKRKDIGGGSMASIHLCEDIDVEDEEYGTVIVKMFNKPCVGDEDLQKQIFNREVEALDKLNHKNIVRMLDRGYDKSFKAFFIVLEYIKGQNFKELFEEICKYTYSQKIDLMMQVIEGIEYLHKKKIVHRDLKPSNLMLSKEGIVKVIDFGISRLKDTFYGDYTLATFATKNYSSPEQMNQKNITYQSDIYSLGLIFYEIFVGENIINRETMDVERLPLRIRDILIKMTKNNPDLRYGTITELKRDIERERSMLVKEKYINLGFTNTVIKRLQAWNYIDDEDKILAQEILEEEYKGKCYISSGKDKEGKFEGSFELYGKRFVSILKVDQRDETRFTIISVRYIPADRLMIQKELAYEIPYSIKVGSGIRAHYKDEVNIQVLSEEILDHETDFISQRENDKHQKNIINKWKNILKLEKQKINEEKSILTYHNLRLNEEDASLEIKIDINNEYEFNYTPDDMLQMTTRKNVHHYLDVGHMREYENGRMIIDLIPQVDYFNIAPSGEISISMRMAEIALNRKRKALKSIEYGENINPEISEIIFNPAIATSKNNLMLTKNDCKSNLIDGSKLESLEKALSSDNIFLLQGPPGTGKTTFISELVFQILHGNDKYRGDKDAKILIASQSHVAVDHSLKKIKELIPDIKMIRIGIWDKLAESSRKYTLDIFCREWTQKVIENCKAALKKYKEKIGIDESLQEKNAIIMEIENISQEMIELDNELKGVEAELEKLDVIDSKWQIVNDKILAMKQMVSVKSSEITETQLLQIINEFFNNLTQLNDRLAMVIEESTALSEQKIEFQDKYVEINEKINIKDQEISQWQEILGVNSNDEYKRAKIDIQKALKENKKKYREYSKVEALCKEWQKRVTQGEGLLRESIEDATLVGATCLGIAGLSDAIESEFDWVIIDEAGKATPPEILVPICLGRKIVLVGDHKQLPPVVDEALLKLQKKEQMNLQREDLELSLFEYLERNLNENCKSVLNEQYRMNPVIGDLISNLFYEGKLISKTSKEEKTIPIKIYQNKPLVWLSTALRLDRKEEPIADSFRNTCEAKIIFEQLLKIDEELGELKLKKETAIIAGYRSQRDKIIRLYESKYKDKLHNMKIEINTVDAFQGRETDIVFYSVVRSNENGNLGFLKDVRRLNVAFSRAKELLVVVGDHQCAQRRIDLNGQENPFLKIIKFIRNNSDDCMLEEV